MRFGGVCRSCGKACRQRVMGFAVAPWWSAKIHTVRLLPNRHCYPRPRFGKVSTRGSNIQLRLAMATLTFGGLSCATRRAWGLGCGIESGIQVGGACVVATKQWLRTWPADMASSYGFLSKASAPIPCLSLSHTKVDKLKSLATCFDQTPPSLEMNWA